MYCPHATPRGRAQLLILVIGGGAEKTSRARDTCCDKSTTGFPTHGAERDGVRLVHGNAGGRCAAVFDCCWP
jgi:hypothetical protein